MKRDWKALCINKIETIDQAKDIIREASKLFYATAVLLVLVNFILGRWLLLDALIFSGFGFWLHRKHSRVAATMLLVFSIIAVINTGINKFGGGEGGRNIIVAIMVLWASIRAVQATYKLPKLLKGRESSSTVSID